MSAVVIPRFTMTCGECGATVTGLATREDAEWMADQHDKTVHPVENGSAER